MLVKILSEYLEPILSSFLIIIFAIEYIQPILTYLRTGYQSKGNVLKRYFEKNNIAVILSSNIVKNRRWIEVCILHKLSFGQYTLKNLCFFQYATVDNAKILFYNDGYCMNDIYQQHARKYIYMNSKQTSCNIFANMIFLFL